jgi:hypothetical protein
MYIYRSFTRGGFEFGGRFYTPVFQGIPSSWRKTITIDGEETVELDFSAHHIRMLYHQEGLDFKGEPYIYSKDDEEKKDKRQIHKYIAMIALNAKDKKSSIYAVRGAIEDDKDNDKFHSDIPSLKDIEQQLDDFVEHHKPISKYVSNDAGIKLQKKDSDIMHSILVDLTKKGIVSLPIHDSVIVQKKYEDILKETMTKQYNNHLRYTPTIS